MNTHRTLQLQQYLDQQLKNFSKIDTHPQTRPTFDLIQIKLQNIEQKLIKLQNQTQINHRINVLQQSHTNLDRRDKTSTVSLHTKTKKQSLRKTPSKLQKQSESTPNQKRHHSSKLNNQDKVIITSPKPQLKIKAQSQTVSTLKKSSSQKAGKIFNLFSNYKQNKNQKRPLQYNLKHTNNQAHISKNINPVDLQRQINECHKSNSQLHKKIQQLKIYESSYLTLRKVFDTCERTRKKRLFS